MSELRKDLLALTASEIQTLSGSLGNLTKEKTKLQRHLEAIQAMKDGKGSGASSCTMAPTLPAVEKVRAASAGKPTTSNNGGGDDFFYQESNFQMLFQAQLELATQAIVCNAAQVVGLMPMYATSDFNSISHRQAAPELRRAVGRTTQACRTPIPSRPTECSTTLRFRSRT